MSQFNPNKILKKIERGLCNWYVTKYYWGVPVYYERRIPYSNLRVDMAIPMSPGENHGFTVVEAKRRATEKALDQILNYRNLLRQSRTHVVGYVCVAFEFEDRESFEDAQIQVAIPDETEAKKILSGEFN